MPAKRGCLFGAGQVSDFSFLAAPDWSYAFHAAGYVMLYPVMLFRAFGIIPMIHGSYQIAGDTADALKRFVSVIFMPPTAGTLIINDAGVAAAGIPVYRVVDRAVLDTRLFHAADDFFKSIQIF